MLLNIGIDKFISFLNRTLKTQKIKAKINKWDYINFKIFCTLKELNLMNWGKYLPEIHFNNCLVFRIYKELKKLNSKNTINPTKI
jgi:hypothetical protein